MRGPGLAQKLKWELDRFELAPERLTIEILESVAGETENEVVVANIAAISKLGCGVDLDDFGTGHGLDPVTAALCDPADQDRPQFRDHGWTRIGISSGWSAAILSMAEQLGLQTLAEGVETPGEHAMLSQLGCGHVQGFGIARPMPVEDTLDWITRHRARLSVTPRIGSRAK